MMVGLPVFLNNNNWPSLKQKELVKGRRGDFDKISFYVSTTLISFEVDGMSEDNSNLVVFCYLFSLSFLI